MPEKSVSVDIGGVPMVITTGKLARLANAACTIQFGDTVVFTAVCSTAPREGADFFPLQVDYREKYSAAGLFPGGYIKREGRPTDKEILSMRMADRPIRPLFPKGFFNEVQIQSLLLSADGENEPDVLSVVSASAALCLSDLPFQGPIGAVRVGMIDGKFVPNPTHTQMAQSALDLIYAGIEDKCIMIEGDASELSEETLRDAMLFANGVVKAQIAAQRSLAAQAGRPKASYPLTLVPDELMAAIKSFCKGKIEDACFIPEKEKRYDALNKICDAMTPMLKEKFAATLGDKLPFLAKLGYDEIIERTVRSEIVAAGRRPDGRGVDDLRPIACEVGVLPRPHGTGLFERGETQALVVTTLGSSDDAQEHDSITTGGRTKIKKFYLHYNFPNYSVNEVGRISGPGRREIGHGNLAERSLAKVIPADYPYTVRCVSEIMGSNGSTSMASVCGGTLSLMDAGVPIKAPVAGISCGLVNEDDRFILLTDIIGAEDHYGDMDFKVSGTRSGITGFQLDLKIPGVSVDILYKAMLKNKAARLKILDIMAACIDRPRPEISKHAPRIHTIRINPEKIGALIGPGGKVIRSICERTGTKIDIEDDGSVAIFASNGNALEAALKEVEAVTAEVEIGKIYRGVVKACKEFGAFVEVMPGVEGLVHISELADYRVGKVSDICKEGDKMTVKVIDIDERGRMRLSRRAALAEIG